MQDYQGTAMVQIVRNAGDLCASAGINTAITRAHPQGVLTGASLMETLKADIVREPDRRDP